MRERPDRSADSAASLTLLYQSLECEYLHVVFTVPDDVATIALQNKARVYGVLFRATVETLRSIAADPQHLGAEIGFFAVRHSWGQTLMHYPHLRCVVPGGGLSPEGTRWGACGPGFFLPVVGLGAIAGSPDRETQE